MSRPVNITAGDRNIVARTGLINYLLQRVTGFFVEPVDARRRQLPRSPDQSRAITVGLMPLGPGVDCSAIGPGLARALNRRSLQVAAGGRDRTEPVQVRIFDSGELNATEGDVDVVLLVAGPGSVPRISDLSHRSLLERGITSMLVYRSDADRLENEAWSEVADHFLPLGHLTERLGGLSAVLWGRYPDSLRSLAALCVEMAARS